MGVIDHPQPGQNAASAGITVPQCGHFTESCTGFAELFAGLDKAASIRLLYIAGIAAFFANAVNLKRVAGGNVMVLVSDLLFDFSDLLREKFDRCATLCAHHVVMTAPVVLVLVTRDAVMKRNFAGQAATREQFQRPIDGRKSNARVGALDQAM